MCTAQRVVGLLLLLGLAGCSKSSRPHIDRLSIDQYEGEAVLGLSREQLLARFQRTLGTQRFVVLKGDEPPPQTVEPWRVTLAAHIIEPDPEKEPVGQVVAAMSMKQRGQDESFDVQASEAKKAVSNRVEDIQEAAGVALEVVLTRLAQEGRALIDLSARDEPALLEALNSKEASVQSAALTLLARKRNTAATRPLLDKLQRSDDANEVRRLMGLLIEVRDPLAVPTLIEVSRAKDNVVQREVVFALAAIGGDEAEAYLWAVSQGHDDPLIRASAEQALEELKNRKTVRGE